MTTHIQDTLTVSLPRMAGSSIAYDLLHDSTIIGRITELTKFAADTIGVTHQVTVGISSFSGTFKSCVDWVKTNFLTGSQLPNTLETPPAAEETQMSHYVPNAPNVAMTTQAPATVTVDSAREKQLIVVGNLYARDGHTIDDNYYDLSFEGRLVGEIVSEKARGYALVLLDSQLQTRENAKQMFSGSLSECLDWIGIKQPKMTQAPAIEAPKVTLTPTQQAAEELATRGIIYAYLYNHIEKNPLVRKNIDSLVASIQLYMMDDDNDSSVELGKLASRLKMVGVFKAVGRVKGSPHFKALVAKYEPTLVVSGGNERGTVVAIGTTAAEVANAPNPPKGQSKGAKKLPPMPVILDVAALEALDRKALQSAMSALNAHRKTDVKGNGKSDDIKIALAKHILGVDNYTPVAKPTAVKGASKGKDEVALAIPQGLTWDEVKGMKYRQLQSLCKVFRSNGLYSGNLAGKGVTSEHLLKSAAAAMRALGHDIQPLQVTPETPADSDNLLALAK